MTTGQIGRASLFHGKVNASTHRVQAFLTDIGKQRFEHARTHLGDLARAILGQAPSIVSDADTIEYLGRGEAETIRCFKTMKKERSKV